MKARLYIPGVGDSEAEIPGGTPFQADDVQKYPLGTLIRLGGRTFAYAKSSGTQIPDVGSQVGSIQHVPNCAVISADAGVKEITITTTDTSGAAHDGEIAANELVGGYVVVFASQNHAFVRQITSNTAVTLVSAHNHALTIGLDSPTPVAIVAGTSTAEAIASPYLNVITGASEVRAVVGVPTVAATNGQFFWLQTWGPCWVASEAGLGNSNNNRAAKWRYNGSLQMSDDSDAYHENAQDAGFVLTNAYGGTQGAPFVMLQITP